MEARFVAKQHLNKEAARAFTKYHYKHSFISVFIGAFVGFSIFCWGEWQSVIIFAFALLLFYLLLQLLQSILLPRQFLKDINPKAGTATLFLYDDKAADQDNLSKCEMNYENFVKLVETEEYFFLYVQKNQAYILDKRSFTHGNPAEFAAFISEKTGLDVKRVKG